MAKRSRTPRRSSAVNQRTVQSSAQPLTMSSEDLTKFAQQYAYVYYDVRSLLLVTILMIILMVALAFVI